MPSDLEADGNENERGVAAEVSVFFVSRGADGDAPNVNNGKDLASRAGVMASLASLEATGAKRFTAGLASFE